jgi:N-acetyl-gamma-glutamyl-phosphate reductase
MQIFESDNHEPWGAYGFSLSKLFEAFLLSWKYLKFLPDLGVSYSLQLPWCTDHKHIPEMAKYSGLGKAPIFQPQIADFVQGMVVNVPLHYAWLAEGTTGEKIHAVLKKHYEGSKFIEVMPLGETAVKDAGLFERGAFLRPDTLANTNRMQLFVFANDEAQQAVLSARLDNLGKGASGAAVQNLNIALGLDEAASL